tara:strand:+ start:3903 stop:4523 length:621 start_codon:yes stop_codon:yes gene_type:complete
VLAAGSTGLILGFSLIIAIGAQNAFVLRQGLLGKHTFSVALFCAISDAFLIAVGINGFSLLIEELVREHANLLFGVAALWLTFYGFLRLRDAYRGSTINFFNEKKRASYVSTLGTAFILTFANPHVYLDTVILIGTVSLKFESTQKIAFGIGAASASFLFFFTLAYSAKIVAPKLQSSRVWRLLDLFIGLIMFSIAIGMAQAGHWL